MTQQQRRAIRRRRRRLAVGSLLALTLVFIAIGLLVHEHRIKTGANDPTFEKDKTEAVRDSMLASFPELGTEKTRYYDETVSDAPDTEPGSTTAGSTTAGAAGSTTAAAGSTVHDYQEGEAYAYAYAGYTPKQIDPNASDWRLMLVNRDYMLPQDYAPPEGLAEAAAGTGVNLDARVAPYYQQMYTAAKADGITLTPLSGHRRISTQKRNFENKIQYYMSQGNDKVKATQKAAEVILPPGTSEHNAGLSMDIISLDVSFENTEAFHWLQAHAEDYGFILRYPKGKEDFTKITYEPWHWRYVGKENAQKINQSGKCLEEYLGSAA